MGRSVIQNVYDAISELELTIGERILTCAKPSSVPNIITTAHLPLRILTPLSRFSNQFAMAANSFNPNEGSGVNNIFWTITELFLLTPISQGSGIRFQNDALVEYCAEFFEKLGDGSLQLPTNTWIQNVTFRPDIIEYPLGTGQFYFGVVGVFTISEKVP